MNFTKQNNPIVIVALILILVGSLAVVVTQVKKAQAAFAANNAPVNPQGQSNQSSTNPGPPPLLTIDNYQRPALKYDPFQHPSPPNTAAPPPAKVALSTPMIPALPLTIRPLPVIAAKVVKQSKPPAESQPDLDIKSLRVSAILKGDHATAIVEGAGATPVTVSEGGRIGGYRVAAVKDDGIILAGSGGIFAISLGSAASPDAGKSLDQPAEEIANVPH